MDAGLRISLYRAMRRIRTVEERIAELYGEQEMRCPVHLCIGQEAAAAGAALALERTDYTLSGHRSHGHYLAKGGDLKAMMAEIYGKATGCVGGRGGSMHLLDLDAGFLGAVPIVGSTIPIAVGTALTSQMKGEKRVTMVFLGDGATEAGVFHESLNFAAVRALPVVFVCENNLYSVYSPMNVRQPDGLSISDMAAAHGIASFSADGNDVEAVHELSAAAVARARRGEGPSFLEFHTYRWREHCGPNFDNDIGYRTEAEFEEWRRRDPVAAYRARLCDAGVASQAELDAIDRAEAATMDAAVDFAKSSPFPDAVADGHNVYAP